jgi:hypothetical protein
MDRQLASAILQSPIEQHFPNRQVQARRGAAESLCLFGTPRSKVFVYLSEYSSAADAARAIHENVSTFTGSGPTFVTKKGLGDEAYWWSVDTEAHGFYVRKGRRLLTLKTTWGDSITSSEAKARITPFMSSIVDKL